MTFISLPGENNVRDEGEHAWTTISTATFLVKGAHRNGKRRTHPYGPFFLLLSLHPLARRRAIVVTPLPIEASERDQHTSRIRKPSHRT